MQEKNIENHDKLLLFAIIYSFIAEFYDKNKNILHEFF